jgi:hypothetical protein
MQESSYICARLLALLKEGGGRYSGGVAEYRSSEGKTVEVCVCVYVYKERKDGMWG